MKLASEVLSPRAARILPWIVAIAFFMQRFDGTVLDTALPGMAAGLKVSPLSMQAVVIVYMVTAGVLIPASGRLADRFGSKRVFVFAVFLFTLGSLLCALAPTLDLLIAARVVQGAGGALMVPVGRLLAVRAYPRSELVRVLGFITIPGLIGPLVGPAVGGLLVEYASWHWIFLINLPVGLIGGLFALRTMPDLPEERAAVPFDFIGFCLIGGAVTLVSLAVDGAGGLHLSRPQSLLMGGAGIGLLLAYWLRSPRTANPLFDTGLFRNAGFAVGIVGNMFSRLGSRSIPYLLPLFFQLGIGFSPLKSGLTMIPIAVASFMGKRLVQSLLQRLGFKTFLILNTLVLGLTFGGFALITQQTPYALVLLQLTVYGVVNSMQYTAMNSVTLIDLSNAEMSSGNMLLSVVMQVSSGIGIAAAATLLHWFMVPYGATPVPAQLMHIFKHTFVAIGLFSMLSGLIFFLLPRCCGRAVREGGA